LLPAGLHAQERDERANLLLDRLEARERIELREQLLERPRRLLAPEHVELELLADLGAELLAERLQTLQGVRGHTGTVPGTHGAASRPDVRAPQVPGTSLRYLVPRRRARSSGTRYLAEVPGTWSA